MLFDKHNTCFYVLQLVSCMKKTFRQHFITCLVPSHNLQALPPWHKKLNEADRIRENTRKGKKVEVNVRGRRLKTQKKKKQKTEKKIGVGKK